MTNGIRFFGLFSDPFADAVGNANEDVQDGLVHIRIQQRNGRKTLTTVQGLSSNYDLKKIVRTCKKVSIALSHSMTLGVTVRCCCFFIFRNSLVTALSSNIPSMVKFCNCKETSARTFANS